MKLNEIKAVITDVDGVLTDGGIYYDSFGNELKRFNVKDGMIFSFLKKHNYIIGVITGRKSSIVKKRCDELNVDFQSHGVKNKLIEYNKFKKDFDLCDKEILYIGDDLNDIEVMSLCGVSVCPSDAVNDVKNIADFITVAKGSEGVFREIGDMIIKNKQKT